MTASTLFTIAIVLILLRVFWLRIKASGTQNENFKTLPAKDQLAVLKECLLNNPSERNFQNLKRFISEKNLDLDMETYRPYMKTQLELSKRKDALEEDDELYAQESRFMDQMEPLEFEEAREAKKTGDQETYITRSLEGIYRLYSDEAIEKALKELSPDYPKAELLLEGYRKLTQIRDESAADDKSLEALRKIRDQWEEDLLSIHL
ncbi:hypothetical protein BGX12_10567 [Fibrobacter sp. UWR4]|uniref:hypothetical protein n=1 Tax=Fibrobacter sp. UWR4 TaxID=1896218 RepID=UPI000D6C508F|nr:hypothetical protein [Fibrobacter sp. UWR4]PWJ69103.1 hypothetical protein BGX12_10567 [Fibrobacter sp. UWR4]